MASQFAEKFDCRRRPSELRSYWGGLARLLEMNDYADQRGHLVAFDFPDMPFEPQRSFVVHGVPIGTARGGHGQDRGQQLLVCLAGSVSVEMRHGGESQWVELATRTRALLMNAGVWAEQHYSGPEAVLLVMSSYPFDPNSYLHEPP